jgi:hypothetical protein
MIPATAAARGVRIAPMGLGTGSGPAFISTA